MKERFLKLYNTDFTNKTNYDLVISTDNKTLSQITDSIRGIYQYKIMRLF